MLRHKARLALSVLALGATLVAACAQEDAPMPHSMIAFTSDRDGNAEVYVMQADGTRATRLTTNPAWDGHPDWSPDGRSIAFISDRDGNWEMYVMRADGTGATRLTTSPAAEWYPAWSP